MSQSGFKWVCEVCEKPKTDAKQHANGTYCEECADIIHGGGKAFDKATVHYRAQKIEPIEAIEAWELNFNLGNATKYIARAGKKEGQDKRKDLEKALNYLHRELYGKWRV